MIDGELEKQYQLNKCTIKYQTSKIRRITLNYGYTPSKVTLRNFIEADVEKMLPDLLRNNILNKPALSLITVTDEIWRRLKKHMAIQHYYPRS